MMTSELAGHMEPDEAPTTTTRIRWWVVLACVAAGATLCFLAYVAESERWTPPTADLFVNLGTAFFLAALLYFVERQFIKRVDEQVQDINTRVDVRLAAQDQEISSKLEDLEAALSERQQQRETKQDDSIAALEDELTYDRVRTALQRAQDVGGIAGDGLTVPCTHNAAGLASTFEFGLAQDLPAGQSRVEHEYLAISVDWSGDQLGIVYSEWMREESAAEAVDRLTVELQRRRYPQIDELNWKIAFRNLLAALDVSVQFGRPNNARPSLSGAVSDFFDGELFVTTAGIESLTRGVLVARAKFPMVMTSRASGSSSNVEWNSFNPANPGWVEETLWNAIVTRAKLRFGLRF